MISLEKSHYFLSHLASFVNVIIESESVKSLSPVGFWIPMDCSLPSSSIHCVAIRLYKFVYTSKKWYVLIVKIQNYQ